MKRAKELPTVATRIKKFVLWSFSIQTASQNQHFEAFSVLYRRSLKLWDSFPPYASRSILVKATNNFGMHFPDIWNSKHGGAGLPYSTVNKQKLHALCSSKVLVISPSREKVETGWKRDSRLRFITNGAIHHASGQLISCSFGICIIAGSLPRWLHYFFWRADAKRVSLKSKGCLQDHPLTWHNTWVS